MSKQRVNPNATFIKVEIQQRSMLAFIDTGATLCLAKRKIIKDWEKLEKPLKITVADTSIHEIRYVGRIIRITIEKNLFIIPTIYQHDSGVDMIIGNNFLKLYQPFTQTNDTVSINHPIKGEITTKILKPNELIKE